MINGLLPHIFGSHKRITVPLIGVLLLLGVPPVFARVGIAPCMEDNFHAAGEGGDLNCTANDINISNAQNLVILDDGCAFPGDTVTFTLDFDMTQSGGNTRYDIGLYVEADGDPNGDGVYTGICNIYSPPEMPAPEFLNLDLDHPFPGTDVCGDIEPSNTPITYGRKIRLDFVTYGYSTIFFCTHRKT